MPESWSRIECEAIVADYFVMLAMECSGTPYSKTEHRNVLKTKLQNRSDGSVEYKHKNISAVLIKAGHVYIRGYKPSWHYQSLLETVVIEWLGKDIERIESAEESLIQQEPLDIEVKDWQKIFVNPPEMHEKTRIEDQRKFKPRKVDYSEREARNRSLGERGERFVLEVERSRLLSLGRKDLINDLEWTSKERGDGAGYDIRSFEGGTDEERFIEVKTTNSGKYQPFLISRNEVEFSESFSDRYSLYRVFEFSKAPAIFDLRGRVSKHVHLDARLFSAEFTST